MKLHYDYIPKSTLATYTYTVRLKIYSPRGLAFSILERECGIGSFDLANELATFKLSEVASMQMVMIIIII